MPLVRVPGIFKQPRCSNLRKPGSPHKLKPRRLKDLSRPDQPPQTSPTTSKARSKPETIPSTCIRPLVRVPGIFKQPRCSNLRKSGSPHELKPSRLKDLSRPDQPPQTSPTTSKARSKPETIPSTCIRRFPGTPRPADLTTDHLYRGCHRSNIQQLPTDSRSLTVACRALAAPSNPVPR